jgi:hypothetical protein
MMMDCRVKPGNDESGMPDHVISLCADPLGGLMRSDLIQP